MKKLYSLLSMAMLASSVYAVNVTFKVNMSNETVSANGVHVAGNFDANGSSGTAWNPSAYPMTDNGNGVYEATIDLEPGMYEFKFINDNDWPGAETVPAGAQVSGGTGNDNRWHMVTATGDVPTVCFGEVADCGKVGVTFNVNMATQTVSALGVHVAGDFQGWDPAGTRLYNPDGGNIYRYIHQANAGDTINFKYVNGDDWPDAENLGGLSCEVGGNRQMANIQSDSNMLNVCYSSCDECQTVDWTLRVDMSNENVSPDGIHVAGSMQGWDPSGTQLTDPDGDGIYEVVLSVQPQAYEYKFLNGNAWGSEEGVPNACGSNGNRGVTLSVGVDTTTTFCFGSCTWPCAAYPDSSLITFTVAMDTVVSADADSGGVWIMGSFTNPKWQDGAIKLMDNGDSTYSTTILIGGAPEVTYKFVNGKPNTAGNVEESADFSEIGGCGIDNGGFSDNRVLMRTENDTAVQYCFNTCNTDCGTTSVSEIEAANAFNVYPNPFTHNTTVEFTEMGNYQIQVMDVTGKVVLATQTNGAAKINLNLANAQKGIYLMNVINQDGKRYTKMLVIK